MKKTSSLQSNSTSATPGSRRALYGVLSVVVAVLLVTIGWFSYLLVTPNNSNAPATNNANLAVTNLNNLNSTVNQNDLTNSVTDTTVTNNDNVNSVVNTSNTNNVNDNGGLVEPDANANTNSNSNANDNLNTNTNSNSNTNSATTTAVSYSSNHKDATTETLYFAKKGGSCGQVGAVQRSFTAGTDPYGQIMIDDLHGPLSSETGYTNAASGIHLVQVQYSSAGPVITVNSAYDTLSDCNKQTATAQLVKTADIMFDLPDTTAGTVTVGGASATNTNSNSNTN